MNTKKILFISHEASLSGAPILVLNLLKKIKQDRKNYSIDVLLIRGGDLYEEFVQLAENVFIGKPQTYEPSFIKRNAKRLINVLAKKKANENPIDSVTSKLLLNQYDLVYSNTIGTLSWSLPFFKNNIPTILAVHELTFAIESTYRKEFVVENINNTSQIIAGSKAVADNLIATFGADANKIKIIHSFVDTVLDIKKDKEILRKDLNIDKNDLIIGIASSQELRKGTDLIPLLVQKLKQKTNLNFKFINLGGTSASPYVRCTKIDAEKLGITDDLIFVEHNKTPNDYINLYDVFLLMSREDPFPLVMLTAAKLKKPIIAFEQSGGAVEFLENGYGVLTPYLDLDAMATEIIKLLQNEHLRLDYGNKIHEKLEQDYSEKKLTSKIYETINDLLK